VPTRAADAAATVGALSLWFASFGVANIWVSGQGSYFKNQFMEHLRNALRSQHHFTTAYLPWANGSIERACREVLRAVRALLSEFRLPLSHCSKLSRLVQSILNNSPSPQRGDLSLITTFTGRPPDSPLQSLVFTVADKTLSLGDPLPAVAQYLTDALYCRCYTQAG
jgi:transposase InsO family protein